MSSLNGSVLRLYLGRLQRTGFDALLCVRARTKHFDPII